MANFVLRLKSCLVPVTVLMLAGSVLGASQAWAFNVNVYRGVNANANTGLASLAPGQFNFNPELSTFNNPGVAPVLKPCNYRFTITGVANNPAQPNDNGTVLFAGASLPVGVYTATFDNNPPGHWGVYHPGAVTALQARAAISAYAQANRGNVVNGTLGNCN